MKFLLGRDNNSTWAYRSVLLLAVCIVAVGAWARLNYLFPPHTMFDEQYFPVMARKYLAGIYQFDVHPPLGKFIIAVSIALLGDTPAAWRWMPSLFGCAMIPLGAVLGWYYFRERVGALLLAAFIAGETMLMAYSRTGVMDIFLVFFMFATLLAALKARRRSEVVWPALLLGLSISIKWAVVTVVVPIGYILWRKRLFGPFLVSLGVSAAVYVAIVYVGALVSVGWDPWKAWQWWWLWHLAAIESISAKLPNCLSSPWWSWPSMLHPMRFYFQAPAAGDVRVIAAIGNPILWWSSTLAVLVGLFEVVRRKVVSREAIVDHPLVPILLGYVFLLLPWVPGTRIPFIYNYLPSYAFALMALVYWICRLWGRRPWGPRVVVAFTACVVAGALFFLPMATGLPMSRNYYQQHIWLESWSELETCYGV